MHFPRKLVAGFVAVIIVLISVITPQIYLAQNPQIHLNFVIFVESVLIPIILASVAFLTGRMRILWFAFMAYIWSVTDDAPVYLDSIFTWPEVTSGFQHMFLEVLLHLLTLLFMSLALEEAFKLRRERILVEEPFRSANRKISTKIGKRRLLVIISFTLLALISSYAQNLPLAFLESISGEAWYRLDILEHIISIAFLYAAVRFTISIPPLAKAQPLSGTTA